MPHTGTIGATGTGVAEVHLRVTQVLPSHTCQSQTQMSHRAKKEHTGQHREMISTMLYLCKRNQLSMVVSPDKGPVMQNFEFSFMLARTGCWTHNWIISDLRYPSDHVMSLMSDRMVLLLDKRNRPQVSGAMIGRPHDEHFNDIKSKVITGLNQGLTSFVCSWRSQ